MHGLAPTLGDKDAKLLRRRREMAGNDDMSVRVAVR